MSTFKSPHYYIPDECFDFGDLLGEHPVEFASWISGDDDNISVNIVRVLVLLNINDPKGQTVDITELIRKYPGRLSRYQDEIKEHILKTRERAWDEETA